MKRRGWSWKEAKLEEQLAGRLAEKFQIDFYEAALPSDLGNVDLLLALGDLYTRQGLLEKGLQVDQRLVQIQPEDPKYHYNLACTHSLLGHLDPAFAALSRAVQLGYDKLEHLREDPDLENLKKDRRYEEILKGLASKLGSGSQQKLTG